MTLLYLLDDDMAVDEEGTRWRLDDDGVWRRGSLRRRPQLRLVTDSDDAVPLVVEPRRAGAQT